MHWLAVKLAAGKQIAVAEGQHDTVSVWVCWVVSTISRCLYNFTLSTGVLPYLTRAIATHLLAETPQLVPTILPPDSGCL